MIVVNFYGGPGSGKSTTAAGVFSKLKTMGVNAELITEYAKDKAWENPVGPDGKFAPIFDNQIYIFAKQHHRLFRLNGQVDVAVTDSPILLSSVYNDGKFPALDNLVVETFNGFNNMNYYLNRVKPYNPKGRNQNEEQAIFIDGKVKKLLTDRYISVVNLDGNEEAISIIAADVMHELRNKLV